LFSHVMSDEMVCIASSCSSELPSSTAYHCSTIASQSRQRSLKLRYALRKSSGLLLVVMAAAIRGPSFSRLRGEIEEEEEAVLKEADGEKLDD